jgi:hypothetical protein
MFLVRAATAFAFAALLLGRFPLETRPLGGLRAELAAAHPQARLAAQARQGLTLFRNETKSFR